MPPIRPIALVVMLLVASCSGSATTASGSLQPTPVPTTIDALQPSPSVSQDPEAESAPPSPAAAEGDSTELAETDSTTTQTSEASTAELAQPTITDQAVQTDSAPSIDEELSEPETVDEPPPATSSVEVQPAADPTVGVQPAATPSAQEQPAAAASPTDEEQFVAGSDSSEPAAPNDAPGEVLPAGSGRSVEIWCAVHAPVIQAAFTNAVYAQLREPSSLPAAVEDLHRVLRQAVDVAPREIQDAVQIVNDSLDVLEPVLRPADWDWGRIDRSLVVNETNAYNAAGSEIDQYNVVTCGLEEGNALPTDDLVLRDPAAVPAGPTSDPVTPGAPPTELEMEILIGELEAAGLSRADATCLADAFVGILAFGEESETTRNRLTDCGFTPERLIELLAIAG